MSEDVKPALTAAEWAELLDWQPEIGPPGGDAPYANAVEMYAYWASREIQYDRHATAALCLYGQPEGFTRRELEMLNIALSEMGADDTEWYEDVRRVASKITALLPPETP